MPLTDQDTVEELHRLEAELRTVVKARMDLERGLANPDALRPAIGRAYRDRDAVTSPQLEEAREGIIEVIAEFHAAWREVNKAAREIERYEVFISEAPKRIQEARDEVLAAVPGVRAARTQIGRRVAAAGLIGVIPEEDESFDG